MMAQPALAAWVFLPFVIAISVWVSVSDMSRMKIPNKAVMALTGVFVVTGLVLTLIGTFTWSEYLWRYAHLVVVLIIGFIMNAAGLLGAGDAKFAAAMAPFIALGDWPSFAYIFAASILIGFVLHRIAKRIPPIRRATPTWESWERNDFPMGLCLGLAFTTYMVFAALYGGPAS
ncbi:prepilin peptidase [Maritimibacter dapengensis]|nr:prepilin peptidase [Maritimibacter dapengensis]